MYHVQPKVLITACRRIAYSDKLVCTSLPQITPRNNHTSYDSDWDGELPMTIVDAWHVIFLKAMLFLISFVAINYATDNISFKSVEHNIYYVFRSSFESKWDFSRLWFNNGDNKNTQWIRICKKCHSTNDISSQSSEQGKLITRNYHPIIHQVSCQIISWCGSEMQHHMWHKFAIVVKNSLIHWLLSF